MKNTLMPCQTVANPRRTTLAHLKDASELSTGAVVEETEGGEEAAAAAARALPQRTANPRRTVLNELPTTPVAP